MGAERDAKRRHTEARCLLVAGLGSASEEARRQRHNLGARVLEVVASRGKTSPAEGGIGVRSIELPRRQCHLVPPQGYINETGPQLRAVLDALRQSTSIILAIVDDCNLPLGRLRLRAKGSAGRHKGLESIEAAFGGEDYHRLRLGIGGPNTKAHVCGEFSLEEEAAVAAMVEKAARAVESWVSEGPEEVQKLMAVVNTVSS
eukprot:NODE_4275_length_690_cov_287.486614.p3 GENE.NODE_4275_length_690_cov_287.486614~~NODE_4275_length_690_cov_287.486614.p3  ORF type:complete len:202 (+),score=71.87 NODE_4275_length_690_cov_287.486614:3-608(+)